VYHHHAALVATIDLLDGAVFVLENLMRRFQRQALLREQESEL
jgi:hypothetical protein